MKIPFYKFHGTGNDFVLIDQRKEPYLNVEDTEQIAFLCHRQFGIGADGLILLQSHDEFDFEMVYFNSDGKQGSMCGNGGRCITAFAKHLGVIDKETRFWAVDGLHLAKSGSGNWVELKMGSVSTYEKEGKSYFIHTGSPHHIDFVDNALHMDVYREGYAIRHNDKYEKEGVNVNFVTTRDAGIEVSTFERGVECETLSCGTGVTAAAMAFVLEKGTSGQFDVPITAKGGKLSVRFSYDGNSFEEVWLCGETKLVFQGEIEL